MHKVEEHIAATSSGERGLTAFEHRYIAEYLKDLNGARAWLRAGGGGQRHLATHRGSDIRSRPHVKAAIDEAMKERAAVDKLDAATVLREVLAIATADANEIVEIRRGCCRYCYGSDHRYQYTDKVELETARRAFEASDEGLVETFEHGGLGFDPKLGPREDCTRCGGEGSAYVHVNDTRNLTPAARALFAGAKQTKDGIEVKLHDKSKHVELAMRHLGLLNDKLELKGDIAERLLNARKRVRGR